MCVYFNGGVQVLLAALSRFVSLVIHGRVPDFARHLFFGARLTALSKEDGGVRPIAVGLTLRRLVAKVAGYHVRDEMSDLLAPRQLGYGVKGGAEAAVHAARSYVNLDSQLHPPDQQDRYLLNSTGFL